MMTPFKAVLAWLVNSKSGDNIELVTEEILENMVDKWVGDAGHLYSQLPLARFEYVVAYFQAYCREGDEVKR